MDTDTRPSTPIPPGACDCHAHVFLPDVFPYDAERRYTPPAATVEQLLALRARLGFARTVVVQPSCYGNDNRALCAALAAIGPDSARGVAVVDTRTVGDAELGRLHEAGVRGLRLNLQVSGASADTASLLQACREAEARIHRYGWHLQLHAGARLMAALAPALGALRIPVVLDHFGGGAAAAGPVADLLGRHDHIWLKLSAPYRVSTQPGHADLREPLRRYLSIAPGRLLWASDWPHTGGDGRRDGDIGAIEPFRREDAAASLDRLARWVGSDTHLASILVDNPAALYGFGPPVFPSATGIA